MKKRFRRGTSTTAQPDVLSRTHSVHVLSNEEELRRALQRAAECEKRTADMMLARSAHYRALLSEAPANGAAGTAEIRPLNAS